MAEALQLVPQLAKVVDFAIISYSVEAITNPIDHGLAATHRINNLQTTMRQSGTRRKPLAL
jgi:hypothetical protein